MDNVSRPLLIALALTLMLAAVWLVALRPKPVAVEKTPLAPTKAIPAAKQASAASDAANAKLQAAAQAADASPAAPVAAAPSATPAKPATANAAPQSAAKTASYAELQRGDSKRERVVQREIRQGKVVVMLFWSADGADDIATRGAIRDLNRRGGKVMVHIIPIGRVGDYSSITRGVTIAQSPTTLIIGRDRRARTIVGLSEPKELSQAVSDALAKR